MGFRIFWSFLQTLWILQVLHMFHTSGQRWTISSFCLHAKRFEIWVFVPPHYARCPYGQLYYAIMIKKVIMDNFFDDP